MRKIIDILVFALLVFPCMVFGMELPNLESRNAVLYDTKAKEILYEKGEDKKMAIASLTKIVTTIVAIENIDNLDDFVVIDEKVLNEIPYDASVAGLKLGDKLTYRDLLYASILPSGADATTALAQNIAGSTKKFVELMNAKAKSLGLENTNFVNVTGYDVLNHYSTPKEILKILIYALDNPLFKEIYETRQFKLTNGLTVYSTLNTYNRYMNLNLSSILGSKTGYTGEAGMCMSSLFETNGRELLLITLGAPYNYVSPPNLKDAVTVIDYLDENYDEVTLFEKGERVLTIPVELSKEEEYVVYNRQDIKKYTEKEYDHENIKVDFDGVKKLDFKDKKGQKIGTLKYYYMDELLSEEDVILENSFHFSIEKVVERYPYVTVATLIIVFLITARYIDKNRKKKGRKRKWKKKKE